MDAKSIEFPGAIPDVVHDEDAPGPPISVPESNDAGEGGKLKMIVQLVKKCLGVKDIAAMRLSLPASLLEPIPNLEYWQYLDRPDAFAAINDSNDPFERMLAVLRFTLTKDLKFVHGKVCKPYNSVLGEHFRAHWDLPPLVVPGSSDSPPIILTHTSEPYIPIVSSSTTSVYETDSVRSGRSSKSLSNNSRLSIASKNNSTTPTTPQPDLATLDARISNLSLDDRVRVVFLTEQISHHPPVSAYHATCPARNLELVGIDHISAKVSGTSLRVSPGSFNKGIFVNITGGPGEGEQYKISYPSASVNGILRGSFYVTVGDSSIITCTGGRPGMKYRTIIEYKEESWLGRAHYLLEGVVHTVFENDDTHEDWTKVRQVPKSRQIAVFEGSWRGAVRWKRVGNPLADSVSSSPSPSHERIPTPSIKSAFTSKIDLTPSDVSSEWVQLLNVEPLQVVPKSVRPLEKQAEYESQKLWESVTNKLLAKEYSEATREKIAIEQTQRDLAAERKKKGVEFVPKYFDPDIEPGWATLTDEGRKAIEEELLEG